MNLTHKMSILSMALLLAACNGSSEEAYYDEQTDSSDNATNSPSHQLSCDDSDSLTNFTFNEVTANNSSGASGKVGYITANWDSAETSMTHGPVQYTLCKQDDEQFCIPLAQTNDLQTTTYLNTALLSLNTKLFVHVHYNNEQLCSQELELDVNISNGLIGSFSHLSDLTLSDDGKQIIGRANDIISNGNRLVIYKEVNGIWDRSFTPKITNGVRDFKASGDFSTIAVSSIDREKSTTEVTIFEWQGNEYSQTSSFSYSSKDVQITLSKDGKTLLTNEIPFSSPNAILSMYKKDGASWNKAFDDYYTLNLSNIKISDNGGYLLASSLQGNSIEVLRSKGNSLISDISIPSMLPVTYDISGDGNKIIVSNSISEGNTDLNIYSNNNSSWALENEVRVGEHFLTISVEFNYDGTAFIVGSDSDTALDAGINNIEPQQVGEDYLDSGVVRVYRFFNNNWNLDRHLKSPIPQKNQLFGVSVNISKKGDKVLVEAPNAYVNGEGVNQITHSSEQQTSVGFLY
ncbi:hypothetical protein N9R79_10700 [Vibrio sp.]|nr:hypothetical protein [Vibrio sp.]